MSERQQYSSLSQERNTVVEQRILKNDTELSKSINSPCQNQHVLRDMEVNTQSQSSNTQIHTQNIKFHSCQNENTNPLQQHHLNENQKIKKNMQSKQETKEVLEIDSQNNHCNHDQNYDCEHNYQREDREDKEEERVSNCAEIQDKINSQTEADLMLQSLKQEEQEGTQENEIDTLNFDNKFVILFNGQQQQQLEQNIHESESNNNNNTSNVEYIKEQQFHNKLVQLETSLKIEQMQRIELSEQNKSLVRQLAEQLMLNEQKEDKHNSQVQQLQQQLILLQDQLLQKKQDIIKLNEINSRYVDQLQNCQNILKEKLNRVEQQREQICESYENISEMKDTVNSYKQIMTQLKCNIDQNIENVKNIYDQDIILKNKLLTDAYFLLLHSSQRIKRLTQNNQSFTQLIKQFMNQKASQQQGIQFQNFLNKYLSQSQQQQMEQENTSNKQGPYQSHQQMQQKQQQQTIRGNRNIFTAADPYKEQSSSSSSLS